MCERLIVSPRIHGNAANARRSATGTRRSPNANSHPIASCPTSGKDIVVNVTVIKPRPDMTYEDLGLVVWNWPFLCVREVKDSQRLDT